MLYERPKNSRGTYGTPKTRQMVRKRKAGIPKPRNSEPNGYRYRNLILKKLSFVGYGEYLSSNLWQGIRLAVLAKHPQCFICHHKAEEVHHIIYTEANLSGESLDGLMTLCAECHRKIEFTAGGEKLSFRLARENLLAICRERGLYLRIPAQPTFFY